MDLRRPARRGWARLLKRVFEIDLEHRPNGGGELELIAATLEPPVIERILTHLGLPADCGRVTAPARGHAPPEGLAPASASAAWYSARKGAFEKFLSPLAAHGMRFTQGYANSPVCPPTRFALMTGRYQYRPRGAAEEPISIRT